MATVTVSTWENFVSAVVVSGDTVNVSPSTVWDMNQIAPSGVPTVEVNCAAINGNGVKIMSANIRQTFFKVNNACTIDDLQIRDFEASAPIIETGARSSAYTITLRKVIFKGQQTAGYTLYAPRANGGKIECTASDKGCAFVVDYFNSAALMVIADSSAQNYSFEYTNFTVNMINGASDSLELGGADITGKRRTYFYDCLIQGKCSYVVMKAGSANNLINCECRSVGIDGGADTDSSNVVNADIVESAMQYVTECTSEEIRSAAALKSKGFPIGVREVSE